MPVLKQQLELKQIVSIAALRHSGRRKASQAEKQPKQLLVEAVINSSSSSSSGSGSSSRSSSSSSFVSFVHSGRGSTALWRIVRAGVVRCARSTVAALHTTCIICGVVLQLARSL